MAKFLNPAALVKLHDLFEIIRGSELELTPETIQTLILVQQRPGIAPHEIAEALGLGSAAMTRITAKLSDRFTLRTPGLGFVDIARDQRDRRTLRIEITPKGVAFLQRLVDAVR